MDYTTDFKRKKVTLMGLGLLGRGIGDAKFFAEQGAELTVTDMKSKEELVDSLKELAPYTNIRYVLGEHKEEDFIHADLVVKGNGVRLDNPYILVAEKAGVRITMSTALFATYARARGAILVGITGTRGKSTVTYMVYEALKRFSYPAILGGNVRGVSTLALLPTINAGDIVVLELDSWQLQGFAYEKLSPEIAVFTNFYPDHQNYYPDMETYFADKANIYAFQNEQQGDVLIVGEQVAERVTHEKLVAVPIPSDWELSIPGEHNRYNASLAREVLSQLGMNERDIRTALASFKGVEGRLEYMGEFAGVKIYNDNNATTPEATMAGINALAGDIILIAGGSDKKTELTEVAKLINARCKGVHLLAGTGTDKLIPLLENKVVYEWFKDVVESALRSAQPGDTILFSPLFASFGKEFVNEYQRNDIFKKIVDEFYAH